jgi:DNA-binding response OmpR family regulator
MPATVLVVEDERKLRDFVRSYLERAGFTVLSTGSGAEAIEMATTASPDLVILDLGLPDVPGETVARELRDAISTPILMLTAKSSEEDRIRGLELGADDYVTKPFSPRELALRVRSVLRRSRGAGLPDKADLGALADGDLLVDLAAHEVRTSGELVQLTSREYDLLVFLMKNPRKAFTREQLLADVWSWSFGDTSTVTVHVRRLREKLEADPTLPRRIVTVWGVGYRFEPEAA